MSKLIIEFHDIEAWEKKNNYEDGVIKAWVEDGEWSAIGEVFDICKASNVTLQDEA